MCVLTGFYGDENYPVFLEVANIFVRDRGQRIWFSGEKLNTLYFDAHYHAWVGDRFLPKCIRCVDPVCMQYYRPVVLTAIQTQSNSLLCISLHHGL